MKKNTKPPTGELPILDWFKQKREEEYKRVMRSGNKESPRGKSKGKAT